MEVGPESVRFADIVVFVEDYVINSVEEYLKMVDSKVRPTLARALDVVARATDAGSLERALASLKKAVLITELPNVVVAITKAQDALESRRKNDYETPARPIRAPGRSSVRRVEPSSAP